MRRTILAFALLAPLAFAQDKPKAPETKQLSSDDQLAVRNPELRATQLASKIQQEIAAWQAQLAKDQADQKAAQEEVRRAADTVGKKNGCTISEQPDGKLVCTVMRKAEPPPTVKEPPKK